MINLTNDSGLAYSSLVCCILSTEWLLLPNKCPVLVEKMQQRCFALRRCTVFHSKIPVFRKRCHHTERPAMGDDPAARRLFHNIAPESADTCDERLDIFSTAGPVTKRVRSPVIERLSRDIRPALSLPGAEIHFEQPLIGQNGRLPRQKRSSALATLRGRGVNSPLPGPSLDKRLPTRRERHILPPITLPVSHENGRMARQQNRKRRLYRHREST